MNQLLVQYSYLQLLDLLTTVAFLAHGIHEGNPIVRLAMAMGPGMLPGLVAVKAAGLLLGYYCWRVGRSQLLLRINVLFALVVAWNMVALIRGA